MSTGCDTARFRQDDNARASVVPVILLVIFSLSVPIWFHLLGGMAMAGQEILLVYPPSWSASEILRQSASIGAPIVSVGRVPFAVTVIAEGPETVANAYASGALLAVRSPLSILCGN